VGNDLLVINSNISARKLTGSPGSSDKTLPISGSRSARANLAEIYALLTAIPTWMLFLVGHPRIPLTNKIVFPALSP
jgi:hypothetical protein